MMNSKGKFVLILPRIFIMVLLKERAFYGSQPVAAGDALTLSKEDDHESFFENLL